MQRSICKYIILLKKRCTCSAIKNCACCFFISFVFASCSSYHSHVIIYTIENSGSSDPLLTQNNTSDSFLYNWNINKAARRGTVKVTRYFAEYKGDRQVAHINDKAVKYALSERYFEAEIIFREALEESPNSPELYNNLGIVYEAQGFSDKACAMYSRACMLDDTNAVFRRNFISFDEYRRK